MVNLLTSIGIIPDYIIGHSVGELICGYADGCLTLEETILLAYYTGLAFFESNIIDDSMADVHLCSEAPKDKCPADIDIACCNNTHNFMISKSTNSVEKFLAELQVCKCINNTIFILHYSTFVVTNKQ